MKRGTTPTLSFELPFSCDKIGICSIAFAQPANTYQAESELVLEKTLADCRLDGNWLHLDLTEEDTLSLDSHSDLEIQLRVECNGKKMASEIFTTTVGRILKDGCLE